MVAPHVPTTLNFSPSSLQCALSQVSVLAVSFAWWYPTHFVKAWLKYSLQMEGFWMLKADIVMFFCVSAHFVTGLYIPLYAFICNYFLVCPFPLLIPRRNISAETSGLLIGPQNHNQSLAAIAKRVLSCMLHFMESHRLSCQPVHWDPVGWPHPYKGVPGIIFQSVNWNLPCSIRTAQLYPYLPIYWPIRILKDQSEC